MTALIVLLVLLVCALGFGWLWKHTAEPPPPTALDPEQLRKTALELHRIRRRLEVSDLKQQQRRDLNRLRRDIAEALDGDQ